MSLVLSLVSLTPVNIDGLSVQKYGTGDLSTYFRSTIQCRIRGRLLSDFCETHICRTSSLRWTLRDPCVFLVSPRVTATQDLSEVPSAVGVHRRRSPGLTRKDPGPGKRGHDHENYELYTGDECPCGLVVVREWKTHFMCSKDSLNSPGLS